MGDRPILFSTPMVQALLAGRKTQTRRVLNPQPIDGARFAGSDRDGQWLFTKGCHYGKVRPPFAVGDRLYVREEYYQRGHWWEDATDLTAKGKPKWKFAAYDHDITFDAPAKFLKARSRSNPAEIYRYKRLGRFMPRRYSRLTLAVTDVRVERLQDCSEADAIAEGIEQYGRFFGLPDTDWDAAELSAVGAYHRLWNSINGPGAWDANPWVVAVSFDVHRVNIDQMPTPAPIEGGPL